MSQTDPFYIDGLETSKRPFSVDGVFLFTPPDRWRGKCTNRAIINLELNKGGGLSYAVQFLRKKCLYFGNDGGGGYLLCGLNFEKKTPQAAGVV